MSRILIISAWYYPFIHPRAHRWTHIAEYWASAGHEVHVVCARRRDCRPEAELNGVCVHRVGFDSLKEFIYYLFGIRAGRGRVGVGARRPGWGLRFFTWLYRVVWQRIYFPDDASIWYFPARRKVRQLLSVEPFDWMVSVSLPFTGHLIGLDAKRRFPDLCWLADIGDPFTIQAKPLNNTKLYGPISRRLENTVLEQADAIAVTNCAATRAYRHYFGPVAKKIKVVSPLLHPFMPNNPGVGAEKPPWPAFLFHREAAIHLGYFGALYAPIRTPDAFLYLLANTFSECPALEQKIQVHFFGDVFPDFFDQLDQNPNVHLYGLRSRQEVRLAMQRMDYLVNIGNTTDFQLPSKAAEYLASGKPVVHLSYADPDPFVAFWKGAPGILSLRILQNRISGADIRRFIAFLEHPPCTLSGQALVRQLQPCSLGAVAKAYEALFTADQLFRAVPGKVEAPSCR
ncbi:MAG: glycosyltransferase [Saprospirales bacterium]|nr:glycosyltransferase [Saprospirales bacterium]MBK8922252.1 glycosyltransferase [Saprospirales bacterium]